MKILLGLMMVLSSTFAMAGEDGRKIKCYERESSGMDLAYIIKVGGHGHEDLNRRLFLLDCTDEDKERGDCRPRGKLEQEQRQNERCLVLDRDHGGDDLTHGSWSLCYEEQETKATGLVPVKVTDDEQDSRIYCERSLLKVL